MLYGHIKEVQITQNTLKGKNLKTNARCQHKEQVTIVDPTTTNMHPSDKPRGIQHNSGVPLCCPRQKNGNMDHDTLTSKLKVRVNKASPVSFEKFNSRKKEQKQATKGSIGQALGRRCIRNSNLHHPFDVLKGNPSMLITCFDPVLPRKKNRSPGHRKNKLKLYNLYIVR